MMSQALPVVVLRGPVVWFSGSVVGMGGVSVGRGCALRVVILAVVRIDDRRVCGGGLSVGLGLG